MVSILKPPLFHSCVLAAFADPYLFIFKTLKVVGRLESRMPYLSVFVPHEFERKYEKAWKNLLENSRKMTTQFDVYATLVDIFKVLFIFTTFYSFLKFIIINRFKILNANYMHKLLVLILNNFFFLFNYSVTIVKFKVKSFWNYYLPYFFFNSRVTLGKTEE